MKIYGGPQLAAPACQVLPPNFPGYQPYCPYTANPGSGKWTAPDMAKAQQLVEESGTAGMQRQGQQRHDRGATRRIGEYFVGLLNKLGYKATPQFLSADIQYPYIQNSKNKVQIALVGLVRRTTRPPSDFLDILLGCDSFHPNSTRARTSPQFCDKTIQGQMDKASTHGARGPERGEQDVGGGRQGDDGQGAVGVARSTRRCSTSSPRGSKGFQFSPQWYFLLAQASVK